MSDRALLRPLGIAAIIDEAARVVRRRAPLYAAMSLMAAVPLLLASLAFARHVAFYSGPYRFYEPILLRHCLTVAGCLLLRWLSHGAITAAALDDFEGRTPGFWSSWKAALQRSGSLCFGGLALWFAVALSGMVFLVPALIIGPMFLAFPFAVMREDRRYFALLSYAFRRGSQLGGRALALQLALALATLLLVIGLAQLVPILLWLAKNFVAIEATTLERIFSLSNNKLYALGLFLGGFLILEPVRIAAMARLALDDKIRRDGFDILDRVRRLTGVDLTRVAALALALLLLGAGAARAEPVALGEYRQRLARARAEVATQLERVDTSEVDPAALSRAAEGLRDLEVSYRGRRFVIGDPGFRPLIDGLGKDLDEDVERGLARLKKRLDFLSERAAELDDAGVIAGEAEARREVEAILSERRFQARTRMERQATPEDWSFDSAMQRFTNWMRSREWLDGSWWRGVKNWFSSWWNGPVGGKGSWDFDFKDNIQAIIVGAVLLAAAVIAWLLLRRYRRKLEGPTATTSARPRVVSRAPLRAYETTEDTWRGDARRFAAGKEFDLAVRSSYAGLLLTLNSRGWIRFDKTRTNWEYTRAVRRKNRGLAERMEPLNQVFDEKWYGKKGCSEEEYREFRSELDRVVDDVQGEGS